MTVTARGVERVRKYVDEKITLKDVLVAFVEILVLSLWIGSMVFFSFGVAQTAFAVLPDAHLAGLVVGASLSKVELLGLVSGPLLMLLSLVGWRSGRSRGPNYSRFALLAIMTAMAGLSRFFISPSMTNLRESASQPLEKLAATDPIRVQFDHLHHYSVALLSICLFSGLVVLFLTIYLRMKK
jgi:hypothetical protein